MSFGGGFLGGGESRTQTTANTTSTTSDLRTAVEGNIGSLVGAGAAVGTPGGGAIVAAPGSTVTQSNVSTGLMGEDVGAIVAGLNQDRASERASVSQLGSSLAAGMKSQAAQLGDIVAATKAPELTSLTKLLPLALLLGVLWLLKGEI